MEEAAMTYTEAVLRTRLPGLFNHALRRRERAEGIASQAVIIGVTAVVGTAIVTAFMNGLGQVFTRELTQLGSIVPPAGG
jgi:hypothetical protein